MVLTQGKQNKTNKKNSRRSYLETWGMDIELVLMGSIDRNTQTSATVKKPMGIRIASCKGTRNFG